MEIIAALILTLSLFFVLLAVCYCGMRSTFWSSLVFSAMISSAFLLLYYPPSSLAHLGMSFPLALYFSYIFVTFLLVVTYVFIMTILDVRTPPRGANSALFRQAGQDVVPDVL